MTTTIRRKTAPEELSWDKPREYMLRRAAVAVESVADRVHAEASEVTEDLKVLRGQIDLLLEQVNA